MLVREEPLEIRVPRNGFERLRVLPIVKQLRGQLCEPHLLQPHSSCALMGSAVGAVQIGRQEESRELGVMGAGFGL